MWPETELPRRLRLGRDRAESGHKPDIANVQRMTRADTPANWETDVQCALKQADIDGFHSNAMAQIALRRHPQMLDEELHGWANTAVLQHDDRDRPRLRA
jgi:hypothetical protein